MAAELPESAEMVIVGGGAVGCSLAYHLAREGRRPLLLERAELGAGSTGRCAGGIRQQFSTTANVRVGMLSRRLLERFEDEVGTSADFRQIGYLMLASGAEQAAEFASNVSLQQEAGLADVRLLSIAEAGELVPELNLEGLSAASWCPSDGLAGPNEVTGGYAMAARRHGAVVCEGVTVQAVERSADRVIAVRAEGSRVATECVINCAGPHAAAVGAMAGVEVPVQPYRRHLFLTEPFALSRPVPFTVDMRSSFYFHPEGAGLLLGMSDPAEPPSFDTSVAFDFLEHLVEHASERVPVLAETTIRSGWAGLYEVSPDHQAIVGESDQLPGLWLCCGFSGHGFMQAPAMGMLLAQVLCHRVPDLDLSAYDPARFSRGDLRPETAVI
ncbi:MAG: NAD(P)/FAD-dependent oxidoreductase [Candidatus Dormibacteria bacterium]